ncbi:hypothetical protein ATK86_6803 [Nocardia fluminea]|uniref:Uncharacterized protein n=1 Tax=Nocardia fluminea TaxID=134984 RepID=A0A2N3VL20_9NOCA|nr:hypothetical protein ATK86_6803 [Nocardia fluminea]
MPARDDISVQYFPLKRGTEMLETEEAVVAASADTVEEVALEPVKTATAPKDSKG